MIVASKEIPTIPAPLMQDTMIEKIRPEITGAGIAYFLSVSERATMALPRKITMAAKPRVHRYSNFPKEATCSVGCRFVGAEITDDTFHKSSSNPFWLSGSYHSVRF